MTKTLTEQIVHIKNEWIDEKCNVPYLIEKDDKDEQIERLQKQLDIVTEQRNDIHIDNQVLQKQLADANKTIDYYDKKDFHYTLADGTVMGAEPAHKYKVKWGVK